LSFSGKNLVELSQVFIIYMFLFLVWYRQCASYWRTIFH